MFSISIGAGINWLVQEVNGTEPSLQWGLPGPGWAFLLQNNIKIQNSKTKWQCKIAKQYWNSKLQCKIVKQYQNSKLQKKMALQCCNKNTLA